MFINYIQNFRELWVISPLYKDREKMQLGRRSQKLYLKIFGKRNRKIIKKLITKWRNIRDTFSKSENKKFRSGQPATKTRKCIYAKQLSFFATNHWFGSFSIQY